MSLSHWLLFALLIFVCIMEWIKNFKRIKDFQESMVEIEQKVSVSARASSEYNWVQHHELDDALIEGGKTYQGRSILGFKISKNGTEKPGIFIEADIHAPEWIAPAGATYIINQLLTSDVESIKDLAASIKDKIQLYESFHAYSQYLLYPFGDTSDLLVSLKECWVTLTK